MLDGGFMVLGKHRINALVTLGFIMTVCYWIVDIVTDYYGYRFSSPRLFFDFLFILGQAALLAAVWYSQKQRRLLEETLVAERKQAEDDRRRTDAILTAIGEGISIQDRSFRVVYQNEAHIKMVGGDYTGEQCHRAFALSEEICTGCPVALTFSDGQTHIQEKFAAKSDESLFIEIYSSPLFDHDGQLVAGIETVRDVTHRWKADQEIRALNQALHQRTEELTAVNRELESFSYSLSHDLRSPLAQIETSIELLAQNIEKSEAESQENAFFIKTIRNGGERIDQMIQGMLDLARIGRGEISRTVIDLSAMSGVIIEELQRRDPERRVTVTIAPAMTAHADPRLSRTVLQNLIENAWKYTSCTEQAEIEIGFRIGGGRQLFFIRDNGAGFNPAFVSRIFMPFQRLHETSDFPGDGIGLSTVYRIIQRHGGMIQAEGAVGQGATFTFALEPAED